MSLMIRLFLLSFLLELGLMFSMQAEVSTHSYSPANSWQSKDHNFISIRPSNLFKDLNLIEVFEKDEESEVSQEDDLAQDFSKVFTFHVRPFVVRCLKIVSPDTFFERSFHFYNLCLFIIFHRWKFDI
jgi:hypothetical protein